MGLIVISIFGSLNCIEGARATRPERAAAGTIAMVPRTAAARYCDYRNGSGCQRIQGTHKLSNGTGESSGSSTKRRKEQNEITKDK